MIDQGQKQVLAQEPDDRRRDAIADEVKGVGGAIWQDIGVGQPHESRRLARGHEPRPGCVARDDDQELTARAATRRSEASRQSVETRFGLYANAARPVWPRAAE